jgi:hypothetical protein
MVLRERGSLTALKSNCRLVNKCEYKSCTCETNHRNSNYKTRIRAVCNDNPTHKVPKKGALISIGTVGFFKSTTTALYCQA